MTPPGVREGNRHRRNFKYARNILAVEIGDQALRLIPDELGNRREVVGKLNRRYDCRSSMATLFTSGEVARFERIALQARTD